MGQALPPNPAHVFSPAQLDSLDFVIDALAERIVDGIASRLSAVEQLGSPTTSGAGEGRGGLPPREFLSLKEAAFWGGISERSIRRARERGDLPPTYAGGRVTVRIADLREYLGRHRS